MEVKLQLSVFLLHIQVSLAVWQHVTVMKGDTLHLTCPISDHRTSVEWKNPEQQIMFFHRTKGANGATLLRDKRYSITKLSQSEFSISISDVTFNDGGNYTCTHYGKEPTERKVEVTVLSFPRMSVTKHEGRSVIKCTAEGNQHAPQIDWKFDHKPEFHVHTNIYREGKKIVSNGMLTVLPGNKRVTLKCLVRHPALHTRTLITFVKIGVDVKKPLLTTTAGPPTVQPQGSTEVPGTTTTWLIRGRTAESSTTIDLSGPSTEESTVTSNQWVSKTVAAPSGLPLNPVTSPGPHISATDGSGSSVLPDSTVTSNVTITEEANTTGDIFVPETTEDISFDNSTETTTQENFNQQKQKESQGNSYLLVTLVTSLIFSLLVVVIFFGIKLRRAHVAWKKENEDSNPSEESSKSKSSQEEKNAQGQRRRGILNTAFTQYVVEEPTTITSVVNTAAMTPEERATRQQTSQPQIQTQTSAKIDIKETSL
ncbi:cytotoxic and regulatory T-cell molecule isoform X2 [Melanotaenia boesemani]|uniref:cytotoxic and regulatory T-cell molecule isoform X2 n=1 Tax=Melanotaenia boesemani TaxID=1250792 RepID=UPI001C05E262|nr:cytotoxic and regulatory T-cell molecule isoform X2 [Melanotaenia boesemani]